MNNSSKIALSIALMASAGALLLWRSSKRDAVLYTNFDIEPMQTNELLPRGYRNNNPLNIDYKTFNAWKGKVLPNTDGRFEQFENLAYGYRAALVLLRNYIKKYGCNTIAKIIARWAPENENNTSGYISRVCETLGLPANTPVSVNNKELLCAMAYAMSIVENGYKDKQGNDLADTYGLPNMSVINQAWEMI